MKRGIIATVGAGIVVCVLAALFYKVYIAKDTKSVTGKELFTDEFVESVNSINFKPFNENEVITIKDKEQVNEFFEILRNEQYNPIDEYDWVEGFYSFDFVTNDGSEPIGIGGNVIAFKGNQHRVVSENDLVRRIIFLFLP